MSLLVIELCNGQYLSMADVSDSLSAFCLVALSGILNRLLIPGNFMVYKQDSSKSP
jgi:hypothetical protein